MCGIAGSIGAPNMPFAEAMRNALRHRGPDGTSVWGNSYLTWAHARLAVIGLGEQGDQPFFSADGRYTVIYNGEIYNHQELRARYGISASPTDGAILPDLWGRLGSKCLTELRGMFSMAVNDNVTGRSWLAVDPMGMKTLYWTSVSGTVYFSSESVPLAQTLDLMVDDEEYVEFQEWGCLPTEHSGLMGVRRLPPGALLELRSDGRIASSAIVDVSRWVRPAQSWDDVASEFQKSVALHLQSDVPTALLLSAGVDSSAIAWAAAAAGHRLHCITLDFDGGHGEAEVAARIARRFGHDHIVVDSATAVDENVAGFLETVDRPSVDGLNTYLACRSLRERGYKVALSGAGGDELLLGYPHHHRRGLGRWTERGVRSLAQRLLRRDGDVRQVSDRLDSTTRILQGVSRGSLSREPWERIRAARSHRPLSVSRNLGPAKPLHRLFRLNENAENELTLADWSNYLVPMLLADADVYSMAASVEMRLPFVDIAVWAAVAGLPSRRRGKDAFVRATGDPVLQEIAQRPKSGFDVPYWRGLADHATARGPSGGGHWTDSRHARLDNWRSTIWEAWTGRIGEHTSTRRTASEPTPTGTPSTRSPSSARTASRPLRIALVTQAGKENGGVGSIVAWLEQGLHARGHQVDVYQLAQSARDPRSSRVLQPRTWRQDPRVGVGSTDETLWGGRFVELETNRYRPRAQLTASLNGYDVVQVVAGTPAIANVVRDVEPPTFLQVATTLAMERPARLGASPARRAFSRALLPSLNRWDKSGVGSVDHVIVENTYMLDWCRRQGQLQTHLIPPGIDTSVFHPRGSWDSRGPIIALGRLGEQRKDWPTVVDAFDHLLETRRTGDLHLVIAGRGPVTEELVDRIHSSPNSERIQLRIDVPTSELPDLLQQGSVFLQASLEEGLGLAGLEAMACGLPVVSTATVGSSQYVVDGENGFLVELGPSAAMELASKVRDILENTDAGRHLSQGALETVRNRYDASTSLDKFESFYVSARKSDEAPIRRDNA